MAASLASQRIARQGLGRPAATATDAAFLTCGIQAQDTPAGRLGVRVRTRGLSDAAVRQAVDVERCLVKSSLMRATVHLVAAEDVKWLTALLGPGTARKVDKRWRDLGLSADLLRRTCAALPAVLATGPLTRREIVSGLAEHGVVVPGADQAPAHVLLHATTEGLVCRGPDRGRDATYALLDDWVPAAPDGPRGDDALAEIARRYFRAYSPATAADFTTWSGLPSGRAVELIRDELTPTDVAGRPGFRLGDVEPAAGLRLLPAWDNYLLGYRDRDAIIDAALRPLVYVGGVIKPVVLLDGRVVGRWSVQRRRAAATVAVSLFSMLPKKATAALHAEIADVGRFLGLPATPVISAA